MFTGLRAVVAQKTIYSAEHIRKIAYADSVLKVAILKKDSLQIAEGYYLLGKIELSAGNFLTSHVWFMKSLRIQEKFGDSYELGRLHIRIKEKEQRQGHFDEAFQQLKIAEGIFKRAKSNAGLMRTYSSLGELYVDESLKNRVQPSKNIQFNIDSAFFYQKKAELLAIQLKDSIGWANIQISLGKLLVLKKDPRAITYFQHAYNEFARLKEDNERVSAMLFLASAYLTFNQPEKVPDILKQIQQFYEKQHLHHYAWLRSLETSYVNYYKATKQWEKAFIHLEILKDLERKELMADQEGAITRLEIEYETQKKEALLTKKNEELALSNENSRTQQLFLRTLAALFLLTAGLGFFYYQLSRKNQQISQRNEVLIREQNHRVKNNLQLVSSLLSLQANQFSDAASKQATENNLLRIESMAILHRRLYDKEELAVINLADFIREIAEVVLQTFGYMHVELDYKVIPVKLNADQALPVGLIITELITNACKYAFPDNPDPRLTIVCDKEKDELELTIADNGPGLKNNLLVGAVKQSFGMKLIQMQVAQMRGTYNFNFSAGTTFTMKFKPDVLL
ncbi:sensor histidine kinase [Emticicia sp. C21]|uniref:sensor histidine kinase n=1 Tax=Emticicia sp. C21 TaxID=2302915 RepID=UPI001314B3CF|nr:sensor histidine kinase [Emticicia sp. C21]